MGILNLARCAAWAPQYFTEVYAYVKNSINNYCAYLEYLIITLRFLFIFVAAIFSTRGGPKTFFDVDTPNVVLKYLLSTHLECRYPSNEKSYRTVVLCSRNIVVPTLHDDRRMKVQKFAEVAVNVCDCVCL